MPSGDFMGFGINREGQPQLLGGMWGHSLTGSRVPRAMLVAKNPEEHAVADSAPKRSVYGQVPVSRADGRKRGDIATLKQTIKIACCAST